MGQPFFRHFCRFEIKASVVYVSQASPPHIYSSFPGYPRFLQALGRTGQTNKAQKRSRDSPHAYRPLCPWGSQQECAVHQPCFPHGKPSRVVPGSSLFPNAARPRNSPGFLVSNMVGNGSESCVPSPLTGCSPHPCTAFLVLLVSSVITQRHPKAISMFAPNSFLPMSCISLNPLAVQIHSQAFCVFSA